MLICVDPADTGRFLRQTRIWPGPHCVCLSRGTAPPNGIEAALPGDVLLFDHTGRDAAAFTLMRDVLLRAFRLPEREPRGPLLFLRGAIDDWDLRAMRLRARVQPFAVAHAADGPDGAPSRLLLGRRIVANPHFRDFLTEMADGLTDADTDRILVLIDEHLVPHG